MFGASYRAGYERVVSFMDGKNPETVVPACPAWTSADVVRHLAGISQDMTRGVFEGFASDEWTDAQIQARADSSLDEVISEWRSTIDEVVDSLDSLEKLDVPDVIESALGRIPSSVIPAMAVSDLLHHELDLRNAYGDQSGRDILEVHISAAGHARTLRRLFAARGLPTLRIESTDSGQGWSIGRDEPVATVSATSFELLRGIGGRRTREEILAWDWEGDAELFVDSMILPHLSMRDTSLGE
ncbi:MAG: maleylpyruvate isomerase family mycothiol-dependent enzyme [Actinomycetota bacterium]|nr:maleylpyruvate isomerase family mycothiol-dependent enzyme [Actinomycetota bacterium]